MSTAILPHLGRGGSDTTGVALAAALKADECQIFTDVDGVYTTDPRVCSKCTNVWKIVLHVEEMIRAGQSGLEGSADSFCRVCRQI